MPSATVTLATSEFSAPPSASDPTVAVLTSASVLPGQCLFADRELIRVVSIGITSGINKNLNVQRGFGGTVSALHSAGQPLYIGNPDQFYGVDPKGSPPPVVPVLPYINVITGDIFTVLGDDGPDQSADRWWSKLNTYETVGPLGVRQEKTGTIQPTGAGAISVTQS